MRVLKFIALALIVPPIFVAAIWIAAAVGIVELILTENENARIADRFRCAGDSVLQGE